MVVPNTTTMAHRVSTEIQSVISNSKTDEEEQEEQSSQHSIDNDDNTLQRTGNETTFSPDPAPIKGGDDEVLRFSHVRSIVVKEAVIMEPEKNKRSSSPGPGPEAKSMGRGVGRNRHSTGTSTIQHTNGNESEASNCKPMDVITKSPYEPSVNAEKGIKVFTDMRSLLSESTHDNNRTVDPKAAKVFGPTNAWCLVKANGKFFFFLDECIVKMFRFRVSFLFFLIFFLCQALIDKSGMVYSQEWVDGYIRGNFIGKMPKDMLLLCLVAKRFVKAGELLLMGLIRDLEVCGLVQEAIKEWNLEDEYPKVRIKQSCSIHSVSRLNFF
jgi:hypothetical protein